MIPHKSRDFRTILDLSFRLRYKGMLLESVNSATTMQAPVESMVQLGNCVTLLIAMLADNYDPEKQFKFAKLDITDGFWRMRVSSEDAWNFCYVLPHTDPSTTLDDTEVVVPNCLQMGWCESPPFSCAASETARNVIEALLLELKIPEHLFEGKMLNEATASAQFRLQAMTTFINLVEVFVNDFIGATNNLSKEHLTHFSRAMFFGVHSIFPPPEISKHQGQDPISQKKLKQGEGTWATTKEILGWLVNGANFTLQLMPEKCAKISKLIKKYANRRALPPPKIPRTCSKAPIRIIWNTRRKRSLLTDTRSHENHDKNGFSDAALKSNPQRLENPSESPRKKLNTPVQLLVSNYPNYIQYTDTCALGAGGVITPGLDAIQYWVWQFEWPDDIKNELVTFANKTGKLTINDLKLTALVLGWMVLEYICKDLTFKHIGMFCDNTSAVAWAYKGGTSRSIPAGRLLRLLSLRQRTRKASSLLPMHIAGENNAMADIPSRALKNGEYFHAHENLVKYFNSHFPLPQNLSWQENEPQIASEYYHPE